LTLDASLDMTPAMAITPDGKRVLCGSLDCSVHVWDIAARRDMATLEGHTNRIWSLVALEDGNRALSGGWDGTLRLWDLVSRSCLKTIRCGTATQDNIFSAAVNRAGTQALSGHRDGKVRLWDLETDECLAILTGHTGIVQAIQITRDGRFAVSSSEDA